MRSKTVLSFSSSLWFTMVLSLILLTFGCSESGSFRLVGGAKPDSPLVVDDGTDGGAFDPLDGSDGDNPTDDPGPGEDGDDPMDDNPTDDPPIDDPTTLSKTDTFVQDLASTVDILFVIDDSGSMNEEQQAIRDNATAFTQRLENAAIDFQVAIVTTNASSDSKVRSQCATADKYITPATVDQFADCAVVGFQGSGLEEGMEAARRALDPDYVNGIRNPGFLRDNAELHIVFVSDEEDQPANISACSYPGFTSEEVAVAQAIIQSEMIADLGDNGRSCDGREAYPPTLANHHSFFQSLKGGESFTAHAVIIPILDGSDDCHRRTNSEEVGKRYGDLASMTGGSTSDVCDDWSETMDVLGLQASGLKDCFALSQTPLEPASILATVNGMNPADGFEYRALGNQVCFNSYPESEAVIEITYMY